MNSEQEYNEFVEKLESFDDIFFETLQKVGDGFFTEIISDPSRSKQTILIISSIITILLAYSLITPIEISSMGVKFSVPSLSVLTTLAGLVCGYTLITFFIGVLQDYQRHLFRAFRTVGQTDFLKDEIMKLLSNRLDLLEKWAEARNESPEDMNKIGKKAMKLALDRALSNKMKYLHATLNKYILFRNIKVLIEIIFPTALGLFGLARAFWPK
jgi:uncharacterized membrane protein YwzB